jgi:hypothetical protein
MTRCGLESRAMTEPDHSGGRSAQVLLSHVHGAQPVLTTLTKVVRLLVLYPHVVAGHLGAQGLAVDQDDPGRHPVCVRDRLRREAARGDEGAPVCVGSVQGPGEFLDLRPPGRPGPAVALGRNVDADEPDNVPVCTALAVAIERNPLVGVTRAFHRSPIAGAVLAGAVPLPAFVVENVG